MTSSILCAQTGIDNPETFENSASYIANWLIALNDDNRLVITAAAQAQRACDVINQAEREPARDARHHVMAAADDGGTAPATGSTAALAGPHGPGRARAGHDAPAVEPTGKASVPDPRAARSAEHADMATSAVGPGRDTTDAREHGGQLHAWPEAPLRPPAHAEGAPQRPQLTVKTGDWQAEAG